MRIRGAIGIAVAMLAALFWVEWKNRDSLERAHRELKTSEEQLAGLQRENGRLSNVVSQARMSSATNGSLSELLKLRGEVGLLRREMESLRGTQRVAEIGWGLGGVDRNLKL